MKILDCSQTPFMIQDKTLALIFQIQFLFQKVNSGFSSLNYPRDLELIHTLEYSVRTAAFYLVLLSMESWVAAKKALS